MGIVPTNDRIFGLNPLSTSVIFGPLSEILDEVNGYDDTHDFNDSTSTTDCNNNDKFKHGPIQNILNAALKKKIRNYSEIHSEYSANVKTKYTARWSLIVREFRKTKATYILFSYLR